MRRGDVVIVATPGDYGKPRPAVVVQTNELALDHASIIVCPITSTLLHLHFRPTIEAGGDTGLRGRSQIMTDKIIAIPRGKVGKTIGRLSDAEMYHVKAALTFLLGLVD